jgi:hypothetical protein
VKLARKLLTALSIVVLATIGIATAPLASAYPTTGKLGSKLQMTDTVGQVVLAWKVKDLKQSSDTIPGYPLAGQLWEAKAGVMAIQGSVTPAIPQFNARAADGTNYRVIWEAYTPQGISGATIPQGSRTHGKIYFDVTGPPPTTVALNNGMEDLLVWTP